MNKKTDDDDGEDHAHDKQETGDAAHEEAFLSLLVDALHRAAEGVELWLLSQRHCDAPVVTDSSL